MQKIIYVILGIVALLVLVILGIGASRVGGVAIRSNLAGQQFLALEVSEPVVRGVPVAVRWTPPGDGSREEIVLMLRSAKEDVIVGTGNIGDGEARMTMPCDETGGSLVLRQKQSGAVLANQRITLLPPGQECIK
ncbi:MAG: hypothetical protein U1C49_00255 [Candidatus Andersenbacteria bacterium]|nr:hypothetical protein [bacterium]MDZ4225256.1 hypothetical protein [Candidatus Andersenbacteria bacterium]